MLLDFTEGTVVAEPWERPHALVVRLAVHPDYEGYIVTGPDYQFFPLLPVPEESFENFAVHEFSFRRQHLQDSPIWVYTAYTDGTRIQPASFALEVRQEGANGWWINIMPSWSYTVPVLTFRLPLPDYEPDRQDPHVVPPARTSDWALLSGSKL